MLACTVGIDRMLAATVVFGRMLALCSRHWSDVVAMADVSWHSCHGLDVGCHSRHWSDTMCKAQVTAAQWLGEQLLNEARWVDEGILPGTPQSLLVGC